MKVSRKYPLDTSFEQWETARVTPTPRPRAADMRPVRLTTSNVGSVRSQSSSSAVHGRPTFGGCQFDESATKKD